MFLKFLIRKKSTITILVSDSAHKCLPLILLIFFVLIKIIKVTVEVETWKREYENYIFQLNYKKYEKTL